MSTQVLYKCDRCQRVVESAGAIVSLHRKDVCGIVYNLIDLCYPCYEAGALPAKRLTLWQAILLLWRQ